MLAWLRLLRVSHKVARASDAPLRAARLTTAQFAVLAHLAAHEGVAQGELAQTLAVTQGNVCQLLDKMQAAGLLRRQVEGRTNRLYLTEAGRALADEMVPAHEALIAAQFSALSVEEQGQLLGLLRKLDRAARA